MLSYVQDISSVFGQIWYFSGIKEVISFHETLNEKNPSRISSSKVKTKINKMPAHCYNPQLAGDDHTIYCMQRSRACAVLRLASAAVNHN